MFGILHACSFVVAVRLHAAHTLVCGYALTQQGAFMLAQRTRVRSRTSSCLPLGTMGRPAAGTACVRMCAVLPPARPSSAVHL